MNLPVKAKPVEVPILPRNHWRLSNGAIQKVYEFRRPEDRDIFIVSLLSYEAKAAHNARITIEEGTVTLLLTTKDLAKVTEIDKEYAKAADMIFNDVVYRSDPID